LAANRHRQIRRDRSINAIAVGIFTYEISRSAAALLLQYYILTRQCGRFLVTTTGTLSQ
jgi:hypothetical protein